MQRDTVKWVCVTLNEGYLRAANRGSKTYTDYYSKYNISGFNEKTIFFVLFFTVFFETADLRSYCGYFLAICQLCLYFLERARKAGVKKF